jgi:hypothetical protein
LLKFFVALLFCVIACSSNVLAQYKLLHQDAEMSRAIRLGLHHVYNFEFDKAQPYFLEIKKKYPQHPAFAFSQALVLFTKNFPMKPGHPDYKLFESHVKECLEKAMTILEKDPKNADGLFCALSANSYQALMHSFSKDYLQAVNSARKAYGFIKQGFAIKKEYPDFYYSSGMFYYYAKQYPETHPMAKPLMVFFEDGNKEKGLNDLNISMLRGIYTKQESMMLLSYLYVKYENKPAKSLEYSEKFYYNYPQNPFAIARYIEGLILTQEYAKAEDLLPKLRQSSSDFFRVFAEVYGAILEEKFNKRKDLAKQHYLIALQMCAALHHKTDDLQSFCYLGLGRIADAARDRKNAVLYYRKALDLAEYESVKKECKQRLQQNGQMANRHAK